MTSRAPVRYRNRTHLTAWAWAVVFLVLAVAATIPIVLDVGPRTVDRGAIIAIAILWVITVAVWIICFLAPLTTITVHGVGRTEVTRRYPHKVTRRMYRSDLGMAYVVGERDSEGDWIYYVRADSNDDDTLELGLTADPVRSGAIAAEFNMAMFGRSGPA